MLARRYSGKPENPRVFAHQASDDIMTLTQYRGVARTRIAFVSDRDASEGAPLEGDLHRDYDGFNPRRVTVNGSLNITPSWTPDGKGLAYVSYRQGSPLVYLARVFEGRSVPNLTGERATRGLRPAFSPDGARLAFASSRSGNMDVFVAGGRRQRRAAADHDPGLGHRPVLEPDRPGDRVHLEPHRHTADLADGRGRPERAPPDDGRQLQRRLRLEPVEAVQRDRLHRPARGRRLRHRRDRPRLAPGPADHAGPRLLRVPVLVAQRAPPRLFLQSRRPVGDHSLRPGGPLASDAGHRSRQQRRSPTGDREPPPRRTHDDCPLPPPRAVFALALAIGLAGLPRRQAAARARRHAGRRGGPGGAATDTTPSSPPSRSNEGPDVRAVEGEGAAGSDIAASAASDSGEGGPLADIRFELRLGGHQRRRARATLEKHASWLQGHRDAKVTVEGHCDERGTVEYNLALGEQRARAVRDYLVSLGVAADRLRTVSYGKERPLDPAADRGGLREEPPRPLRRGPVDNGPCWAAAPSGTALEEQRDPSTRSPLSLLLAAAAALPRAGGRRQQGHGAPAAAGRDAAEPARRHPALRRRQPARR